MPIRIAMLLFPDLTQLDLTAPYEVLSRLPEAEVSLVWKSLESVTSGTGLRLAPSRTLADAGPADVLFVPGGSGLVPLLRDEEVLGFLRRQAATARYVTAVCTGSLLLGAAGLLEGYRATTHWAYHEFLERCGAIPVRQRVVIDRNRVTAGGVTAGMDFALRLAAELCGEQVARGIQLGLEYDPEPPFDSGTPERATAELVQTVLDRLAEPRRGYAQQLPERY
ncbi:MAG TPA: DJ-1/PfpI family protein [Steroidobacteraceae bacterium]|jgi:cyclohexyl-isocyanide hydratase|nr:DJ-1/PfpI family protein [Steroidobacteraceae bacterium]